MTTPVDLDALAREVLGLASLHPAQRRAITAAVDGRDVLAVLPTGSGKCAIYQLAGWARGGATVVVSPLIALQHDQVRSLTGRRRPRRLAAAGRRRQRREPRRRAPRDAPALA